MKAYALNILIVFALLGQLVHALGLCSSHARCAEETLAPVHACSCGHDEGHPSSSHPERQPLPYSGHCDSCCSVDTKVVPSQRIGCPVITINLDVDAPVYQAVSCSDRFGNTFSNEKLPETIPLYLAKQVLLI